MPSEVPPDLQSRLASMRMVRERTFQEYQELLGLDIAGMAVERVQQNGRFTWYDLCCGEFNAGPGLLEHLFWSGHKEYVPSMSVVGIEAATPFEEQKRRGVLIRKGNAAGYLLPPNVDLVTCLRGVQYIEQFLGQGAQAVQQWYNAMPVGSLLAFDCNPESDLNDGHPILVQGEHLWKVLEERLGNAVKTGRFFSSIWDGAFTVKIRKQGEEALQLPV